MDCSSEQSSVKLRTNSHGAVWKSLSLKPNHSLVSTCHQALLQTEYNKSTILEHQSVKAANIQIILKFVWQLSVIAFGLRTLLQKYSLFFVLFFFFFFFFPLFFSEVSVGVDSHQNVQRWLDVLRRSTGMRATHTDRPRHSAASTVHNYMFSSDSRGAIRITASVTQCIVKGKRSLLMVCLCSSSLIVS